MQKTETLARFMMGKMTKSGKENEESAAGAEDNVIDQDPAESCKRAKRNITKRESLSAIAAVAAAAAVAVAKTEMLQSGADQRKGSASRTAGGMSVVVQWQEGEALVVEGV